ncbi:glucosaminidase domain-containing protein [Flavobacterium caseinilyticum]|uniref:Peptidoglycan hydrolase n=1 Tax=Flavobacterium caseinilyticum TaxID=2541732 RepID=A0A4R5B281_9FLAO|nr:glucosaminidase domain-containing protein [Flavobacterium caseinilyticum]TDD78789.1 LysM peptidoglycan-binding domain-containing protein [Flavobacterium caseinilyticum]
MVKKILLLVIAIIMVGCNAAKPVIITTKKAPLKPKTEIVRGGKKPVSTKTIVTNTPLKKPANPPKEVYKNQVTEVIVSTSQTVVSSDVVANYIAKFKDIAMDNMKMYGIPASIVLAQGILESGAGRGDLAITANNHFGIKCHEGWAGESVKHDDDAAQECFRKYDNVSESFKDHALFLTGRSRYSKLFAFSKDDYKAWARGLRAAGYATDPKYPDKLISYIQRYKLDQFDNQVLGVDYVSKPNRMVEDLKVEPKNSKINLNRDLISYVVQKGDTLYSISKKFNLDIKELKKKNNLVQNGLSIGQQLKI